MKTSNPNGLLVSFLVLIVRKIYFSTKKNPGHILRFLNIFLKEANLDSNTTTTTTTTTTITSSSFNSKILRLIIDFQRIS